MIPPSVKEAYWMQSRRAAPLLAELDRLFKTKPDKWFYMSRMKSEESFHQKVESGVIKDIEALEDFVGAMLVVPMLPDLADAVAFVNAFFIVDYSKPSEPSSTQKRSSDFPFDDLRLYGRLRPPEDLPARPIDEILFEVQIKTFLQHAWAIATHDLVYKFDRVSWARSRVAYQLKAILEHADISVSSMAHLESSEFLPSVGDPESHLQSLIELVDAEWRPDVLPFDRRRLAMNLSRLLEALDLSDIAELRELLERGKDPHGGGHAPGLSPYQCVVEYASRFLAERLRVALMAGGDSPLIFVTRDVLMRLQLNLDDAPRAML